MKRVLLLLLFALFFFQACASNMPSKCDIMTEPSLLCSTFKDRGVRIEDVGNTLIIANAIAIGEGLYTRQQAINVLKELRSVLDKPSITYLLFYDDVTGALDRYPGLFDVAMSYMNAMVETQFRTRYIYRADKEMLKSWLDKRITGLERL